MFEGFKFLLDFFMHFYKVHSHTTAFPVPLMHLNNLTSLNLCDLLNLFKVNFLRLTEICNINAFTLPFDLDFRRITNMSISLLIIPLLFVVSFFLVDYSHKLIIDFKLLFLLFLSFFTFLPLFTFLFNFRLNLNLVLFDNPL